MARFASLSSALARAGFTALLLLAIAPWGGCSSDHGAPVPDDAAAGGDAVAADERGDARADGTRPPDGAAEGGADAPGAIGTDGAAEGGSVPAAWTCYYFAYGDGPCDCGCGAPDKDCAAQDLAHCAVCTGNGGCGASTCPGHIDPADVTRCAPPPPGWTCAASAYGDGKCDCGCGAVDEDCPDTQLTSCQICTAFGSCANGPCPSSLAPGDNTRCEVPVDWTCTAATYGDGTCNCGCSVVDVDCADRNATSCQVCDSSSCSPVQCAVDASDNAHCPNPPSTWRCAARLYHDGVQCDCGCGAVDPDCTSTALDACDTCDVPGSCSAQPCPGLVDAQANDRCDQPEAPPGWTCPGGYGDGIECDCGCGVPDPDCRSSDFSECVRCLSCGGHGVCQGTVDPTDTTQCAPPPSGWTCSAAAYRDAICDCGCGLVDLPCQGIALLYVCGNYPVEGCTAGNPSHIDPNDNAICKVNVPSAWTCNRSYYDDGFCDCGCGAVDLDCPANAVSECKSCNGTGSCSRSACPGTIGANDTAHCSD